MRLKLERDDNGRRSLVLKREVVPLEGTNMSLFHTIIPNWWAENGLSTGSWIPGDNVLAERVWVANRCIQMNAQQIATMPLQFHGPEGDEPAWISNPDPHWYPNGISDAMHFIVEQIYGWGYSCQYVTDRYADGFPRTWTVLDNYALNIRVVDGNREYKLGEDILDPSRVIQIDRNPGARVHGYSALRAYAQLAYGLMAAGNQAMTVQQGGTPKFYLKSDRAITTKEQAEGIRDQWMTARAAANGAPPVVGNGITPTEMSFNPSDLALLETQEFDAKAIMTAFGVPAPLMNMALQGGLTYQNPAALGEMWWRFELRTTATRIANAFSAQALPRGQWVSADAADTFLPLDQMSEEDDTQASQVAKASPAQRPPLTAIGGGE